MSSPCYLYLSCKDAAEAQQITDVLLKKRYIACAKRLPVESAYWWQGKIESDQETMLLMESDIMLFGKIEAVLEEMHSYDTFVLQAVPIVKLSEKALVWLYSQLALDGPV